MPAASAMESFATIAIQAGREPRSAATAAAEISTAPAAHGRGSFEAWVFGPS